MLYVFFNLAKESMRVPVASFSSNLWLLYGILEVSYTQMQGPLLDRRSSLEPYSVRSNAMRFVVVVVVWGWSSTFNNQPLDADQDALRYIHCEHKRSSWKKTELDLSHCPDPP